MNLETQPVDGIDVAVITWIPAIGGRLWRFEASHGDAGLLVCDLDRIAFTALQAAFLRTLVGAWLSQSAVVSTARGFVPTTELVRTHQWAARFPDASNVKQLVIRLRALLKASDFGIEGRRGRGYRLTGIMDH